MKQTAVSELLAGYWVMKDSKCTKRTLFSVLELSQLQFG